MCEIGGLCAGEDTPREINISAHTNQEKLMRGGKGQNRRAVLHRFHAAILWFQAQNRSRDRHGEAKLFLRSVEQRNPASDQAQWQHESREHELLSGYTAHMCWSDLISPVHPQRQPLLAKRPWTPGFIWRGARLWSLISAKNLNTLIKYHNFPKQVLVKAPEILI